MKFILFIIAQCAKVSYKCLSNHSSKTFLHTPGDFYRCNFIINLISTLLFVCLAFTSGISLYSILMGAVFGVLTMLNTHSALIAFSTGPLNITDLITTSSMLIPAVSGVILYNEKFSVYKLIATLFLIFFISLCAKAKNVSGAKPSRRWAVFCLLAFITQGAIGVMQKIHQKSSHSDEIFGFLTVAFFFALVSSALMLAKDRPTEKLKPAQFIIIAIQGVCMFLMNYLNLKLAGMFDSQLFFPVSAGVGIIAVLIISVTVFKEKLTKKQVVGLVGGIISLICITAL